MAPTWQSIVLGSSISFSFTLVVTQSFMTVPALLVDFPNHSSPNYAERATLLGRQWPHCWAVGNMFFRPISTLGALGYAYSSYCASHSATTSMDWRVLVVAALMHEAKGAYGTHQAGAEALLRKWRKWNILRVITPTIAGCVAMWQLCL
ncbi:uncharacterized protein K444DRAFT_643298 [Hyaloscypha bicolor E]|uniref:DUF1772-domain-containing protein n=1 Tax=Hyaloscypha bicolor E TaxID=1095630 RepID=A0A2J6TAP0_9HELO|nr:uncharacterized protein K444DRAFT_643298 [Hyaloscypha bicolor E]PMD60053.1 hypothetical protein K444DRAFT_643298 [Hyaloscypha bicolor E]